LSVTPEVVASLSLPVISAAIGNTVRIFAREDYDVPIFIWMMLIAESGFGKSHAINFLMKTIKKMQLIEYRKFEKAMSKYKTHTKSGQLDEPKLTHLYASDFTTEALSKIFSDDQRGILIYRDEISGLITGLDQYKAKGKGDDRQRLIELFDAGGWKIDRKDSSPLFIPNTGASIIGGIQPKVMNRVFHDKFFDDGLLPRFLFLHPQATKFSKTGISNDDKALLELLIEWCYEIPVNIGENNSVNPNILKLDSSALDVFANFNDYYEEIGRYLSYKKRVFLPKLITYSLKFAGLLHELNCFIEQYRGNSVLSGVISEETMLQAIELTEFFRGQSINSVELYEPSEDRNDNNPLLIETLYSLKGNVSSGKLTLNVIRDEFNKKVSESQRLEHDNKLLGSMLRNFGFETKEGSGGIYYLVWNDDKIEKLYDEMKSTMSTKSTPRISRFAIPLRDVTSNN